MVVYVVVFAVFIIGFLPLIAGFISTAQLTADASTSIFLAMIIPFLIIIMIIAFFMRMRGTKPPGVW